MVKPVISSHAMVRFLERALGADLTLWREAIAADGRYGDTDLVRAIERSREGSQLLAMCRETISDVVRSGVQHGAVSVYFARLTFCLRGACVMTVVPGRAHPTRLRRIDGSRLYEPRIAA